ncbi:MAG: FAD-binding oxidoreductase, partial [Acidimicrobiales bacterium]
MSTETTSRGLLRRAVQRLDAFATPHGIDRYVELVAPTWSSTEVRGRVTAVRHGTADSVTLTIRPNGLWNGFTAGQFTQLTVEIDGVRHTRCYSMATSAHEAGAFELTVKAHPHGTVSRFLKDHAAVGLVVGLSPAAGAFTLPAVRPDRLLLLSGGSGITPVMAMLRTLCAEGHDRPVTFVHYALTEADMIYRSELAALAAAHPNVRLVRIFTDAPGTGDLDGFLTPAQLDAIDPAWRTTETYLCGPAPLMDGARAIYDDAGAGDRLHTEAFTLTQVLAESGTAGGTLRLARSAVDLANDGRPILEQAEAAGLSPVHGCRMGICHTCTRSLTCGTVRDLVTGDLTTAPAETGVT